MNIKQALKKKNKLVQEISEQWTRFSTYNSVEVDVTSPYNALDAYTKWKEASAKLVDLKASIHRANFQVYPSIFEMSELKNQIKLLRQLDCAEGKIIPSRYGNSTDPIFKKATIGIIVRDQLIKDAEARIEEIQDSLDIFNASTNIELSENIKNL